MYGVKRTFGSAMPVLLFFSRRSCWLDVDSLSRYTAMSEIRTRLFVSFMEIVYALRVL